MARKYILQYFFDKTGAKGSMGFAPTSHAEACTLLSKITPYPGRRVLLVEVAKANTPKGA